jgi:hypothetical protein
MSSAVAPAAHVAVAQYLFAASLFSFLPAEHENPVHFALSVQHLASVVPVSPAFAESLKRLALQLAV